MGSRTEIIMRKLILLSIGDFTSSQKMLDYLDNKMMGEIYRNLQYKFFTLLKFTEEKTKFTTQASSPFEFTNYLF